MPTKPSPITRVSTWRRINPVWTLAVALAVLSAACRPASDAGSGPSSGPRRVTLALNWFPEAEHGGFYAAQVHGYFAEEGLAVEIRPGGPGAPVIQQVATRRVEFAVTNADEVLLGRDRRAPVVAVLAPLQDSPRCIMVHEQSGIRSLLELRDLTLAVGSGKPYAKFLLSRLGPVPLTIIPYQGNVGMFLQRPDFAQQAYVFSEPFVARQQGAHPHCLMLSEIGFNPYTSVLICHEQLIAEDRELVAKMVRACVRGWRQYLDDPRETNQAIAALNPEMGLDILDYGAEVLRTLCLPDNLPSDQLGRMTAARWRELAQQSSTV
jgi:NitT/TauT family transport system substrate-binding protein